jgi:ubiquitin-conjugating enzyme E2 Q
MAFHGSPLYNWHGIIREGLHFKETQHGRAYGHGVYHSLEFNTSSGYSGSFGVFHNAFLNQNSWHRSQLLLGSAVALNEVVNAPAEYVSKNPHLVVQHVDWIQTRFLFVTCKTVKNVNGHPGVAMQSLAMAAEEVQVFKDGFIQDPGMPLNCPGQKRYDVLPLKVGSSWKAKLESQRNAELRKRKANVLDSPGLDDDTASVMTIDEDIELFSKDPLWEKFSEIRSVASRVPLLEETVLALHGKEQAVIAKKKTSSTGFVPGSLDHSTLQKLPPPLRAHPSASKAIMAALKQIKSTVETEDIVELGWYVDVEQIDNIFQWIVELHSFPTELPITRQMKQANMSSVVIEMRFPESFPFAPPFARVIRPKFLPFMNGGGGHVTQGGSICMELLTGSGWSPALSIMNVLLNIRLAMCETGPAAQLDMRYYGKKATSAFPAGTIGADLDSIQQTNTSDYGISEAIHAYIRACQVHNWKVPEGFDTWSRTM